MSGNVLVDNACLDGARRLALWSCGRFASCSNHTTSNTKYAYCANGLHCGFWPGAVQILDASCVRILFIRGLVHPTVTVTASTPGTLYFIMILVLSVTMMVLSLTKALYFAGFMPPISHTLQTVLLSHFYLNLHEASANRGGMLSDASQQPDLRFARIVGTLAQSSVYDDQRILAPGDSDVEDDLDADEEQREHREAESEVSMVSRSSAVDHESHPSG
ncbi:uncharacterized protein B0H18DRAFT_1102356 [Fomitopsis serialis]|uniref:uncharacterized protein n=1 Tax=Fomitopsis serialis TaxID=139415 RepID=UPI002007C12C|nr:uncharacterized protein B0H18DRAFT_1102356 [Neoantrodia serialis]KAH9932623.1 hypothetical protein B0H18DRAFT_1102356 [Neoantrodia serialis]